ncbi:hypothetical protein Tco_1250523 [Tanacetum coccineum]
MVEARASRSPVLCTEIGEGSLIRPELRWMIYLVVLADAAESVRDVIGFEYTTSHPQADGQSERVIQTLEDIMRACVIDLVSGLIGPDLVLEMIDKVVLIKEKLKAARDRQKSYADKRRKLLEFKVGD